MTDRLRTQAALAVKKDWVQQGLWQPSFEGLVRQRYFAVGVWKHQEPLALVDDDGVDLERYPNTYARLRRHRDASRPCYQFRWQVDKVRDRLLDQWWHSVVVADEEKKKEKEKEKEKKERAHATTTTTTTAKVMMPSAKVDSEAYWEVRQAWEKRRIWDNEWEVLPGQHWRHERPLEELLSPQEAEWYAEIKATWVEPGFAGPHRLVHRVEAEKEVLEIFERRRGGILSFRDGMVRDPQRGLKRGRSSSPWHSSLPSSDLGDDDESGDEPISQDDEPLGNTGVVEVPDETAGSAASDSEAPGSTDQSSPKRRRRAYKSPFVVDDDENSDP
ncbi:hypothetical protein PG994_003909 [Apiospora phragmitis]|uniref:Uncharacterized protein n=1 Tax=Apiospora phragmitis TaxID=2905665 RepID=A0ABR1VZG0_9PEZI